MATSRQGTEKYTYKREDISINAEFFHDKCIQIQFSVSDRLMTPDLVKTLLDANGGEWKMLSSSKDANGVVTESTYSCSGAIASAHKSHLVISVANYEGLLMQSDKEHEKKVEK
jgi:aminopeptidase C